MRRRSSSLFLVVFVILFVLVPAVWAADAPVEQSAEEELRRLNLEQVEAEAAQLMETVRSWAPDISFRQLVADILHGKIELTPAALLSALGRSFWGEVWGGGALIGKILVLAVILAVLQHLSAAFERTSTSQVAFYACFLALVGIVLTALGLALRIGREGVENMVSFIQALLPVLLTLLAMTGGVTTAAVLHPTILATLAALGTLVKNVVLPLITFGVILGLVDRLSDDLQVSRLADLTRNAGLALLGVASTVLIGVLTVQGVAGAVAGGVALRTAKYAAGAFVPVVGGMLADAFEAVVGTSLLLKNAVGIAGIIIIFFAVAFPAVKLFAMSFLFKLAGALAQPLEGRVAACLDGVGTALLGIFAVVATVGLLCFFAVAVVVALGHITTMLR
ncbi:MAG: stage III sporulation protein AE [Bacillota bacterium]|jgi:stage III sporulation protein AE|nr:stage III sporulation protein AE [Thermoanaerobacteraceae bacterium]